MNNHSSKHVPCVWCATRGALDQSAEPMTCLQLHQCLLKQHPDLDLQVFHQQLQAWVRERRLQITTYVNSEPRYELGSMGRTAKCSEASSSARIDLQTTSLFVLN